MSDQINGQNCAGLAALSIGQLFGRRNLQVDFAPGGITLLHGPNGAGKSTVFRIIESALGQSPASATSQNFKNAQFTFTDGLVFGIDRDGGRWFEIRPDGSTMEGEFEPVPSDSEAVTDQNFLNYLRFKTRFRLQDGAILRPSGERIPDHDLDVLITEWKEFEIRRGHRRAMMRKERARAGEDASSRLRRQKLQDTGISLERQSARQVRLISSDRLVSRGSSWSSILGDPTRAQRYGPSPAGAIPAILYVAQSLAKHIRNIRSVSLNRANELDATFVQRFIETVFLRSSESDSEQFDAFRDRTIKIFQQASELQTRLSLCGLAHTIDPQPEVDPEGWAQIVNEPNSRTIFATDSTLKTAIEMFFADRLSKLQQGNIALPRLELLRSTLNDHFIDKQVEFDQENGLRALDITTGAPIPLVKLSSGEQHLIVLLFALLFETPVGGICLVDEPEISLNIGWQERFVPTLKRIVELRRQQIVVATHSPQIAGSHGELLRLVQAR